VKEKISIEEFDGKNYQIKLVEPYDKAIITHYLHNYRNGVSKHYKKDAVKVLNNFIASYFAGALIISRNSLTEKLTNFFELEEWKPLKLHQIIKHYNCSQETFYQRLTSILPKYFNIKNLFSYDLHTKKIR